MKYRIPDDIKNNSFSRLYLLYGKEDYLKHQFKDRLIDALLPQRDGMNLSFFVNKSGKKDETESQVNEIISMIQTIPFFAPKRIIVLENLGLFKNSFERLSEALLEIPDTSHVIILETEMDERKKLFKTISRDYVAEKYDKPDENTLKAWITSRLQKEGKRITGDAISEFITYTGLNMNNMDNELNKLISYCLEDDVITISHIHSICTRSLEEQIFNIANAIAAKDREKTFKEYNILCLQQVAPRDIFRILSSQFCQVFDTLVGLEAGMSMDELAKALKVKNTYAIKKRAESAKKYNKKSLKRYVALSSDYSKKMNTGLLNEKTALEMYILQCLSA